MSLWRWRGFDSLDGCCWRASERRRATPRDASSSTCPTWPAELHLWARRSSCLCIGPGCGASLTAMRFARGGMRAREDAQAAAGVKRSARDEAAREPMKAPAGPFSLLPTPKRHCSSQITLGLDQPAGLVSHHDRDARAATCTFFVSAPSPPAPRVFRNRTVTHCRPERFLDVLHRRGHGKGLQRGTGFRCVGVADGAAVRALVLERTRGSLGQRCVPANTSTRLARLAPLPRCSPRAVATTPRSRRSAIGRANSAAAAFAVRAPSASLRVRCREVGVRSNTAEAVLLASATHH